MKNNKATILLVDDTEANIDILLGLLGNSYDMLVALDGQTAIEIAEEEEVDLILLDIMMPDISGYDVCKILKNNRKTREIPIIFITAKTDEESIETAYEIGGLDYVTKPFKPRELKARIKTQLKLKSVIDHLEYIASCDSMTGIYNRRKFFELAMNKFDSSKNLFAAMIDIDNFKSINDNYGHSVGDEVIKTTVSTINEMINEDFIFGRLGGEEFVLLYDKNDKDFLKEVENIVKGVELQNVETDGGLVSVTISSGVAKKRVHTKNIDMLIKDADDALYEAKKTGRNRVVSQPMED